MRFMARRYRLFRNMATRERSTRLPRSVHVHANWMDRARIEHGVASQRTHKETLLHSKIATDAHRK